MNKGIRTFIALVLAACNIMRLLFTLTGNDLNNIIIPGYFNDLIDVPTFSIGTVIILESLGLNIKLKNKIIISTIIFSLACTWELISYHGYGFGPWTTGDKIDIIMYAIGLFIAYIYFYLDSNKKTASHS